MSNDELNVYLTVNNCFIKIFFVSYYIDVQKNNRKLSNDEGETRGAGIEIQLVKNLSDFFFWFSRLRDIFPHQPIKSHRNHTNQLPFEYLPIF